MSSGSIKQRNAYKGSPPRPWVRLRLKAPDGTDLELDLLADTGNPCALILSQANLAKFQHVNAPNLNTNFGPLTGGWVHVLMPDFGLDQPLVCYGSDAVVSATKASSPDLEGLLGLPLLRMLQYGGDADWFWIRSLLGKP
jgi:hypothetical protein